MSTATAEAHRRLVDAAAAGNRDAQRALEALTAAAAAVPDHGAEKGLREARRRFGTPPGDAA